MTHSATKLYIKLKQTILNNAAFRKEAETCVILLSYTDKHRWMIAAHVHDCVCGTSTSV